ncbi:septum formation inhibitor Maf [Christiangramia sp. SM2212]|uniref:Septum formation inhibitor Maf n=1 Tax=Christiangramia sediminicola TaxID=3073267 RepID=A0ABU1EPV9_9FLAO|nr:septum formation inhibitor Maf [Christiangramia sp. SM2212]MDR5590431.1 septum formation inhibitor Maf [Christiangramia sp. SM2212]
MMFRYLYIIILSISFSSCDHYSEEKENLELSKEFKNYWYSGEAEITSYELKQARYGEIRDGEAVLIYVTEDFLPEEQVKAAKKDDENISVLKLNATKNFNTGIYPYSIMQSSFYPLNGEAHTLKLSASIQEWCGQVYMQLNNHEKFEIESHSYFAGEADEELELNKVHLENEFWNRIRIDHESLPTGEFMVLPTLEYLRLSHNKVKTYKAIGEYYISDEFNVYQLTYPELNRKLKIYYSRIFPFSIEKWEESYPSSSGNNVEILTTIAVKKERLRTDYWNKNSNKNLPLRQKLDLK